MQKIILPKNQMLHLTITGKFEALDENWQHLPMPLFDYELIVVTDGVLYMSYGDEHFTVKKGEYLVLPPGGKRDGFKKAYCSFYWMHFLTHQSDGDGGGEVDTSRLHIHLDDISFEDETTYGFTQYGRLPHASRMIVSMKQLQDMKKNSYPQVSQDALATAIITELYGQLRSETLDEGSGIDRKQVYQDILDYIQENLSRNVKISEIADQFGYNPKYLSHLFDQLKGVPLKQYILSQKMEAANFLLTDTDNSISDISESLGFSDVHNFSRTYKKIVGLTPTEYRDTYAKRLLYHV